MTGFCLLKMALVMPVSTLSLCASNELDLTFVILLRIVFVTLSENLFHVNKATTLKSVKHFKLG